MKNPSTTRLASALMVGQNTINDEGKRSRGRPSRRWQDDITEKEGTTWIRKAADRRRWKTLMEGYILQWMDKAQMKIKISKV